MSTLQLSICNVRTSIVSVIYFISNLVIYLFIFILCFNNKILEKTNLLYMWVLQAIKNVKGKYCNYTKLHISRLLVCLRMNLFVCASVYRSVFCSSFYLSSQRVLMNLIFRVDKLLIQIRLPEVAIYSCHFTVFWLNVVK